jgi:hypothetical protein
MLSRDEISRVGSLCAQLGPSEYVAFSLASAHRTLPVYQAYAEQAHGLYGYGVTHDAVIGVWRLLRGRAGATAAGVGSQADIAIARATADREKIQELSDFGVPEALAVESISAALFALSAFRGSSSDYACKAAMSALEIDSVWAEADADRPDSSGVVDWAPLRRHYEQQARDLEALSNVDDPGISEALLGEIQFRAESEGLYYLNRMREAVSADSEQ